MDRRWQDAVLLAETRRRRRIKRLLRQMERLETRRRPRRTGGGHRRAAAVVALVLLMLGGLFVVSLLDGGRGVSSALPDRPFDAQDAPIGEAPDGGLGRAFSFVRTQDGSAEPVTYDPCVPIHLVVQPRTIVEDGTRLLEEALDELRETTGLTFVVDGLVEDVPADDDLLDDEGAWRPVVVEWTDARAAEDLAGRVAGRGGSAAIEHEGRWWFVTGSIRLDGPQLAEILAEPNGWASARAVVMHELGHVVGLGHVETAGELMQPEGDSSLTRWGPRDRAGLAALGRGRCIDY